MARAKPKPLRAILEFHNGINDGGQLQVFCNGEVHLEELVLWEGAMINPAPGIYGRVRHRYTLFYSQEEPNGLKIGRYVHAGWDFPYGQ